MTQFYEGSAAEVSNIGMSKAQQGLTDQAMIQNKILCWRRSQWRHGQIERRAAEHRTMLLINLPYRKLNKSKP